MTLHSIAAAGLPPPPPVCNPVTPLGASPAGRAAPGAPGPPEPAPARQRPVRHTGAARVPRCAAVLLAAAWAAGAGPVAAQTAPTVTGLTTNTPASGDTYRRGETITATVTFSHNIAGRVQSQWPILRVQIGSVNRDMTCTNCGSSGTSRGFSYTVQVGDSDTDGISIRDGALDGGTLTLFFVGTLVDRTISSSLEIVNSANHKVDSSQWAAGVAGVDAVALNAPAVGDTFERGEVIEATVTFNRAVDVTGTPRLALTVGANTRQATYATGHGSTALTFRYTVVQADADPDGIGIVRRGVGTGHHAIRAAILTAVSGKHLRMRLSSVTRARPIDRARATNSQS